VAGIREAAAGKTKDSTQRREEAKAQRETDKSITQWYREKEEQRKA